MIVQKRKIILRKMNAVFPKRINNSCIKPLVNGYKINEKTVKVTFGEEGVLVDNIRYI